MLILQMRRGPLAAVLEDVEALCDELARSISASSGLRWNRRRLAFASLSRYRGRGSTSSRSAGQALSPFSSLNCSLMVPAFSHLQFDKSGTIAQHIALKMAPSCKFRIPMLQDSFGSTQ
jgi:hypothetical protein